MSRHSAYELIKNTNLREIGETGFQEVKISLGKLGLSETKPDRELLIRTLRLTNNDISRSLFCLFSPRRFKGICFLMKEYRGKLAPLEIHLLFPYGLNLIRKIDSNRRCQYLIGMDFSYDDLKTWVYEEGHIFEIVDEDDQEGNQCVVIQSLLKSNEQLDFFPWVKKHFWIDKQLTLLRKIESFERDSEEPYRTLTLSGYHEVDRVLLPKKMHMKNYKKKHETIISLNQAWHNRKIQEELFLRSNLKKCKDYLAQF